MEGVSFPPGVGSCGTTRLRFVLVGVGGALMAGGRLNSCVRFVIHSLALRACRVGGTTRLRFVLVGLVEPLACASCSYGWWNHSLALRACMH